MGKILFKTGLAAVCAAATIIGGMSVASEAAAQPRYGWNGGYYGDRYYGRRDRWRSSDSVLLGAAIGAALVGGGYYGRGYYEPRYYGPRYRRGYYGRGYYRPRAYAYGYGPICVRRVWDPYLGRRVRVRTYC
jgi:hypothetical protein